jgi:hypothetical protein
MMLGVTGPQKCKDGAVAATNLLNQFQNGVMLAVKFHQA